MIQEVVPVNVDYFIQDLIERGYILVYIRSGESLDNRKVVVSGGEFRVDISIKDISTYNVGYFLHSKTGYGTKRPKRPYIKLDDEELDELRSKIDYILEELILWVYEEESFIYTFSHTTNKVVRLG